MSKGKKPVLKVAQDKPPKLNTRIAVRTSTRDQIRDFVSGVTGEYDDVLRFMLVLIREPGESNFAAGRRLKGDFEQLKETSPDLFDGDE